MTREEHLVWCKQRAHEYLDRGDLTNAVTSMMSDLDKHPETRASAGKDSALVGLGVFATISAQRGDRDFVQRYIDGFN